MFYLLAIALCLAVLFLVLLSASLFCLPIVRLLYKMPHSVSPAMRANLIFVMRLLPAALA